MENIKQWSINYRPQLMKDVYGAQSVKSFVETAVKKDEWPRAILLTGKYGTGKTTVAQIIARTMVCNHLDAEGNPCNECPDCKAVIDETFIRDVKLLGNADISREKDGSMVESVKKLVAKANERPFFPGSRRKVIIFDEIQELAKQSPAALNALLKSLENKNSKTYWIFTAMDPMKGSGISSRMQIFNFYEQSYTDVLKYLVGLAKRIDYEGMKLWDWILQNAGSTEEEIKTFATHGMLEIAKGSEGSLRTATQMLEQCIKTRTFTLAGIRSRFSLVSENDIMDAFYDIANNVKSDKVLDTLAQIDNNNYTRFYFYGSSFIKDAEMAKVFGKIKKLKNKKNKETGEEEPVVETVGAGDFVFDKAVQLTKSPNYSKLRDIFIKFNVSGMLSKDIFITELLKAYD